MSILSNTSLKSLDRMDEDERDPPAVLNVTSVSLNREHEPLLNIPNGYNKQATTSWKERAKEFCYGGLRGRACFPRYPSYELVENCPCIFTPFHYFIKDRLPIIGWIRRYTLRHLISDIIAGLAVGLMVVPQAIAYAGIAGLPLQVHVHVTRGGAHLWVWLIRLLVTISWLFTNKNYQLYMI